LEEEKEKEKLRLIEQNKLKEGIFILEF